MSDEEVAVTELEEARLRHRARQAGRDALGALSALVADDHETAERIALTCETPRSVAYAASCYAAGILQAFTDLADDPSTTDHVLAKLTNQIETMELP